MDVRALLSAKGDRVAKVRSDLTIEAVVNRLKEEGVGALVVSDDGESIVGIISERDVVRGLARHGRDLVVMKVAELMTAKVKTCSPDAKIQDVMSMMTTSRFRHLPVVEDGRLCGIISIGDVVKNRLEELEDETSTLRDFIVGRS
jgi:CBS domain-containing protein